MFVFASDLNDNGKDGGGTGEEKEDSIQRKSLNEKEHLVTRLLK